MGETQRPIGIPHQPYQPSRAEDKYLISPARTGLHMEAKVRELETRLEALERLIEGLLPPLP